MERLTLITSNAKKAEQLQQYLGFAVEHQAIDLLEIQSTDVVAIATDKAERAYALLNKPVIVEDTSLAFSALAGLPGPLVKWFLKDIGSAGLCRLLDSWTDKSAEAVTALVLRDETGAHVFVGRATGTIAETPRGDDGFGWNNIFIPDGASHTWAEMDPKEMEKDSMRVKAVALLSAYLHEHYKQ